MWQKSLDSVESCPIKGNLSRQLINCLMILKPGCWIKAAKPESPVKERRTGCPVARLPVRQGNQCNGGSCESFESCESCLELESRRRHAHHKWLMATHTHCICSCICNSILHPWTSWHSTAVRCKNSNCSQSERMSGIASR